jgi:hypothetical protein
MLDSGSLEQLRAFIAAADDRIGIGMRAWLNLQFSTRRMAFRAGRGHLGGRRHASLLSTDRRFRDASYTD